MSEIDLIGLEEFAEPFRRADMLRMVRVRQTSIDAKKQMHDRGRRAPKFGNVRPKKMGVAKLNLPPLVDP